MARTKHNHQKKNTKPCLNSRGVSKRKHHSHSHGAIRSDVASPSPPRSPRRFPKENLCAAAASNSTSPPNPDLPLLPAVDPLACDAKMRAALDVTEQPVDAQAADAICTKVLDILHGGLKQLMRLPLQPKLSSDVVVALVQPLIDHGPNLKKLFRHTMSNHVKKLGKILQHLKTLCIALATMLTPQQRLAEVRSLRELGDTLCRFQIDLGNIPYDKQSRTMHLCELSFCGALIKSLACNTVPSLVEGSGCDRRATISSAISDCPVFQRCTAIFNSYSGGACALSLDMLLFLLELSPEKLLQQKANVASALHARIMSDITINTVVSVESAVGGVGVGGTGGVALTAMAATNNTSSSSSGSGKGGSISTSTSQSSRLPSSVPASSAAAPSLHSAVRPSLASEVQPKFTSIFSSNLSTPGKALLAGDALPHAEYVGQQENASLHVPLPLPSPSVHSISGTSSIAANKTNSSISSSSCCDVGARTAQATQGMNLGFETNDPIPSAHSTQNVTGAPASSSAAATDVGRGVPSARDLNGAAVSSHGMSPVDHSSTMLLVSGLRHDEDRRSFLRKLEIIQCDPPHMNEQGPDSIILKYLTPALAKRAFCKLQREWHHPHIVVCFHRPTQQHPVHAAEGSQTSRLDSSSRTQDHLQQQQRHRQHQQPKNCLQQSKMQQNVEKRVLGCASHAKSNPSTSSSKDVGPKHASAPKNRLDPASMHDVELSSSRPTGIGLKRIAEGYRHTLVPPVVPSDAPIIPYTPTSPALFSRNPPPVAVLVEEDRESINTSRAAAVYEVLPLRCAPPFRSS